MENFLLQNFWLVPCYPLIGTILTVVLYSSILGMNRPRIAGYINLLMTALGVTHNALAMVNSDDAILPQKIIITWLNTTDFNISFIFEISSLTMEAIFLITGLNLLIQLYAIGYMEIEGWPRFYALMGFYNAAICGFSISNSLFFAYVFYELMTLITYLLVGFWFGNSWAVTGARDAFWTKRIGDIIMLMGVIAIFPLAGTWNFTELAHWAKNTTIDPQIANLLSLALITAPLAKGAQFPFWFWLDEAMEEPMPTTMLRNSLILGTGAFVLAKLEPIVAAISPLVITIVVVFGSLTAIVCSLIAIAQIDIKRTLSYSASAYIGVVFISIATNHVEAARFLIFSQSAAMVLLYMSAGAVSWNNITQDLTQLGGLWSRRPISGLAFVMGAIALFAVPPFGGFWGLLQLADGLLVTQPLLIWVLLLFNGLTAFSLTRAFCLVFGGQLKPMTKRSPEVSWPMVLPMVILIVFTLFIPILFQSWSILPSWASLNKQIMLAFVGSSVFACFISGVIYLTEIWSKPIHLPWKALQNLFARGGFYMQRLYQISLANFVTYSSRFTAWCDRYIVDGIVNGVGLSTLVLGQFFKYSTSGHSQLYILLIFSGLILAIFLLGVR